MLQSLDGKIDSIINDEKIFAVILKKKEEFSRKGRAGNTEKFSELTFCTLTANTSAEMGLRCQEALGRLHRFDEASLRNALVKCHYRFPNTRSRFIAMNYENRNSLEEILKSKDRRNLLIERYMGIGMKEASHFLRNIGYFNYPILDKHIQKFLSSYFRKNIQIKSKKDYEREEKLFLLISTKYGLEPGIMDLVIWYLMTGKVLK